MISRRRLAIGLAVVAAALLTGRVAALIFSDHAWYAALGATSLWQERIRDRFVLHLVSAVFAALFALVNLSAVRRSIISLAFPRRLGNVEFGEEVPQRALDRATFLLAILVAAVMSLVVPPWESLARVRLGARFGEIDPFYQMDLSFYTAWLPLETAAYLWCLTLLVVVAALVIALYAMTPSLRWHRGSFHVSVRVRRHLAVLASMFLLSMAWSYRLDSYELLIRGSGADGMFSYVDHQWLIPAYLSLSVGTVAAAALVLLSGWLGQVRAGFFTISAVLIFSIAVDLILPSVVRRLADVDVAETHQAPYAATRSAFTARAYGLVRGDSTRPKEVTRFLASADSAHIDQILERASDSALVYPGAHGAAIVKGSSSRWSPRLGQGFRRLAHAWSERRLDLLWAELPSNTLIAKRRDVRERITALVPFFAQGSAVSPAYLGDTLVWVLELYSASHSYPLSRHYLIAGSERAYFRHSATSIINSETGRVIIVPAPSPDPLATAWRARFPANVRAGGTDILDALTPTPRQSLRFPIAAGIPATDSAFRAEVTRLYARMRVALAAGDLSGFASAYDTLGAVVGR
jgi:uncharacterized membrane protein (UPF0182 family)